MEQFGVTFLLLQVPLHTSPSQGFDGIIDSSNECRSGSGDTLTFTPPVELTIPQR